MCRIACRRCGCCCCAWCGDNGVDDPPPAAVVPAAAASISSRKSEASRPAEQHRCFECKGVLPNMFVTHTAGPCTDKCLHLALRFAWHRQRSHTCGLSIDAATCARTVLQFLRHEVHWFYGGLGRVCMSQCCNCRSCQDFRVFRQGELPEDVYLSVIVLIVAPSC